MVAKINRHSVRIFRIGSIMAIFAALITGCVKDQSYSVDGTEENPLVRFSVRVPGTAVPSTRAMDAAAEAEVRIVDIILFEPESDGGGFHFHTTSNEIDMANNREGSFAVRLPVGVFDMVMIANAADQVAEAVGKLDESSTKERLQELLTVRQAGKWETGENDYTPIPMWGEKTGQQIKEGIRITDIDLVRMLSRINVSVGPNAGFVLKEVHLVNPYSEGFVIPSAGNWKPDEHKVSDPSTLTGWAGTGTILSYGGQHIDGNGNCLNEIYTFEAPAGSASEMENNTFVIVGGYYGQDALTETISYYRIDLSLQTEKTTDYLPLLRNHRYNIYIQGIGRRGSDSIEEASDGAQVEITVSDDGDMHYFVYDEEYYIGLQDRVFPMRASGSVGRFSFVTDHPEGWTALLSDDPDDPGAGMADPWLTVLSDMSGFGDLKATIEYSGELNTESTMRSAYFHIMAGRLRAVVEVRQSMLVGNLEQRKLDNTYVGAFWKHWQTGERLIWLRHEYADLEDLGALLGDWTVTVIEGADWIKIDDRPTEDKGITRNAGTESPADMLDPQNDAKYQVTGNNTRLEGTCTEEDEGIYFRIGLKSTIGEFDDPRYGVILIQYGNNYNSQLLFVRQGEQADYLMRPEDGSGNNTLDSRPAARKWVPYNLTAEQYKDGSRIDNNYILLPLRSAQFTDYPSQGGAYFQWAKDKGDSYERAAWNPTKERVSTLITYPPFATTSAVMQYWNNLNSETCPQGYRRPSDGSKTFNNTTGGINNSEIRESLWLNPRMGSYNSLHHLDETNANALWGYLADGFFDRRAIKDVSEEIQYAIVEKGTGQSAFRGLLLYNPENNATLFFPRAGSRVVNTGRLEQAGKHGTYWTATLGTIAPNATIYQYDSWRLLLHKENVSMQLVGLATNRNVACSIRCIVDE